MNRPEVTPYKLPIFKAKDMLPEMDITPELYIQHFINGQKCTILFSVF